MNSSASMLGGLTPPRRRAEPLPSLNDPDTDSAAPSPETSAIPDLTANPKIELLSLTHIQLLPPPDSKSHASTTKHGLHTIYIEPENRDLENGGFRERNREYEGKEDEERERNRYFWFFLSFFLLVFILSCLFLSLYLRFKSAFRVLERDLTNE